MNYLRNNSPRAMPAGTPIKIEPKISNRMAGFVIRAISQIFRAKTQRRKENYLIYNSLHFCAIVRK
jgi:hypothetical protein